MGIESILGAVAGPLIGGLMGGSDGGTQTQSTQNTIDPRMADAVYGAGGILPSAKDWYATNKSGLNSQMLTGMDNQSRQLESGAQGWNQMQNLGMGLMGGGTAGNPFTGGGSIAPSQQTYQPAQLTSLGSNPFSTQYSTDETARVQREAAAKAAADEAARLATLQQQFQPTPYSYGGGNYQGSGGYGSHSGFGAGGNGEGNDGGYGGYGGGGAGSGYGSL